MGEYGVEVEVIHNIQGYATSMSVSILANKSVIGDADFTIGDGIVEPSLSECKDMRCMSGGK